MLVKPHPIILPSSSTSDSAPVRIKYVQSNTTIDNDEIITIHDNTVTWSVNGQTLLQHTLDTNSTLIDVILCHFTCTTINELSDQPWLVIVCTNHFITYSTDGAIYTVVAPFKIDKCTVLLEGIMVQRTSTNSNNIIADDNTNGIFDEVDNLNQQQHMIDPILYSLLHPLEEFKPVSTTSKKDSQFTTLLNDSSDMHDDNDDVDIDNITISLNESLYATMNNVNEQLVWTCSTQPLLLTYNSVTRVHKLYVVRQSKNEVTRRLHFLDDQQLNNDVSNAPTTAIPHNRHRVTQSIINEADQLYKQLLQHESAEQYSKGSITPELILDCVYTQTDQSHQYTSIFLAADIKHTPLLCMHDGALNVLHAYKLCTDTNNENSKLQVQFEFSLQCIAAAPIRSLWNITDAHLDNPYNNDIVLIDQNHKLSLYTGNKHVYNIDIDNVSNKHYNALTDAHSNRVTLSTSDGDSYRVTINTGFHSSLVQRCIQSIATFLPAELLHHIRCDLIHSIHMNADTDEFNVLHALIHQLINKPVPVVPTIKPIMPPLRSRPSHTITAVKLVNQLHTSSDLFAIWLHDVLKALHLLYEDMKLNVLHKSQRDQLIQLCCSIAHHLHYIQYIELYSRDSTVIAQQYTILQSDISNQSVHPVDIYQWIQQCICGTLSTANNEFPQLNTHESPYDLSRKIRLFYDILFTNQSSFNTLVQHQYTQQQLNNTFIKPTSRRRSKYSLSNKDNMLSPLNTPLVTPRPSPPSNNYNDIQTPVRFNLQSSPAHQLTPSSPFGVLYTPSFIPQQSPLSNTSGIIIRTAKQSPMLPPKHSPTSNGAKRNINDELPLFSPLLMKKQQIQHSQSNDKINNDISISINEQLIHTMIDESFTLPELASLPYGISLPLYEALYQCRLQPMFNMSTAAYALIERYDLCKMFVDYSNLSNHTKYLLKLEQQLQLAAGQSLNEVDTAHSTTVDVDDSDGTYSVMFSAINRFHTDQRLKEVRHILSSTRYVCLTISADKLDEQYIENSTFDLGVEQQLRLLQLCKRILSLSIGRGMFTLWSTQPIVTKSFTIPKLNLSGRIPPKNAIVELDITQLPTTYLDWPKYHNGVASGLRISKSSKHITRTWILLNREARSCTHAGFILGLGLSGHLDVLIRGDFYWYLASQHIPTQISVVLGMSVSKRGTRDPAVQQLIVVHVPALLSTNLQDMEIPVLTQSIALLSCGLLYQGTADRLIFCRMLEQFQCESINESVNELDTYILCAGIACGLLTIGKGDDIIGLSDINIVDRLIQYFDGGSIESDTHESKLHIATQQRPHSKINIDLTAPAATLALTLMYLHTNNTDAAKRITIPNTLFQLNYVRPDYIMLRIIARNMIMWNNIQPTVEWIESQIPSLITQYIQPLVLNNKRKYNNENSSDNINQGKSNPSIDYQVLRQVYGNIICGACYCIGMRYAGTGNTDAALIITQYIRTFRDIKRKKYKYNQNTTHQTNLNKLDRVTLDHCIYTCIIGLSLIMAGTGDLDTFRLIRSLRTRIDTDTTYGQQMCIHMCIGLLFLGSGTLTLSNSVESIAVLLIAFYPRWPSTTDDNRYHIQVLRHLYVLAVQPRHIQTIDVLTNQTCNLSIQLQLYNTSHNTNSALRLSTPCLLPPIHTIQSITIDSPNYWSIILNIQSNPRHRKLIQNSSIIYVQSRYNHKDQHVRLQHNLLNNNHTNVNPLIQQFQHLFVVDTLNDELTQQCQQIIQKCAVLDVPHIINVYMHLITVLRTSQRNVQHIDISDLCNIKLIIQYYRNVNHSKQNATLLISTDILNLVEQQLSNQLYKATASKDILHKRSAWYNSPSTNTCKTLLNHIKNTIKSTQLNPGMIALVAMQYPSLSIDDISHLLQQQSIIS